MMKGYLSVRACQEMVVFLLNTWTGVNFALTTERNLDDVEKIRIEVKCKSIETRRSPYNIKQIQFKVKRIKIDVKRIEITADRKISYVKRKISDVKGFGEKRRRIGKFFYHEFLPWKGLQFLPHRWIPI